MRRVKHAWPACFKHGTTTQNLAWLGERAPQEAAELTVPIPKMRRVLLVSIRTVVCLLVQSMLILVPRPMFQDLFANADEMSFPSFPFFSYRC